MSTAAPLSIAAQRAPAAASVAPAVRCENCGAAAAALLRGAPAAVRAHGKLLLLAFFYLVSGTLMLALTTAYSALTL
jgi:hypothetical protein